MKEKFNYTEFLTSPKISLYSGMPVEEIQKLASTLGKN